MCTTLGHTDIPQYWCLRVTTRVCLTVLGAVSTGRAAWPPQGLHCPAYRVLSLSSSTAPLYLYLFTFQSPFTGMPLSLVTCWALEQWSLSPEITLELACEETPLHLLISSSPAVCILPVKPRTAQNWLWRMLLSTVPAATATMVPSAL